MDRFNLGVLMIMIGAALHTQFGLGASAVLVLTGYVLTRPTPCLVDQVATMAQEKSN